jgi:hypothetical protein
MSQAPHEPHRGDLWRRKDNPGWVLLITVAWAGAVLVRRREECPLVVGCAQCRFTTHEGVHLSEVEQAYKVEDFLKLHDFVERPSWAAKRSST